MPCLVEHMTEREGGRGNGENRTREEERKEEPMSSVEQINAGRCLTPNWLSRRGRVKYAIWLEMEQCQWQGWGWGLEGEFWQGLFDLMDEDEDEDGMGPWGHGMENGEGNKDRLEVS